MKIAVKFLIALGLSLLLVWAVRTYAFTVFTVPAGGLPPHLEEGNRVIVNRIDCDFFNRGEIVVYADSVALPIRNQSLNQGRNQGLNQSHNQGLNQSRNQSRNQSHNQGLNQGLNQSHNQGLNPRLKRVIVEYFIGRIEKLPGDTLRIGKASYIIPMVCCKRCGCKDCRFYLLKTPAGEQLVHKHQMIGKAYKLF